VSQAYVDVVDVVLLSATFETIQVAGATANALVAFRKKSHPMLPSAADTGDSTSMH
jgi:hypothetical protein